MTEDVCIPGLYVYPEFITKEQEQQFVDVMNANGKWGAKDGDAKEELRRRVQHFGFRFDYTRENIDLTVNQDLAMPQQIKLLGHSIREKCVQELGHCDEFFDQCTVNEYHPGQGINPHVDRHSAFGDFIISLSMSSGIVMCLMEPTNKPVIVKRVYLPPRSLLVLSGQARYVYKHHIEKKTFDVVNGKQIDRQTRLSFTFRKVHDGPCECAWPRKCDSRHVQDLMDNFETPKPSKTPSKDPYPIETHWEQLDPSILVRVFGYLDAESLINCEMVFDNGRDTPYDRLFFEPSYNNTFNSKDLSTLFWRDVNEIQFAPKSTVPPPKLAAILRKKGSSVQSLRMGGCIKVTDKSLDKVMQFCNPDTLQELDISGSKIGKHSLMQLFETMPNFHSLFLGDLDAAIDTFVLQKLSSYRLKQLDLRGCQALDDDLLSQLVHEDTEWLSVRGCDSLTTEGLHSILKSCPNLQHLDIQECHGMGNIVDTSYHHSDTLVGPNLTWFNMKRVKGINLESLGIEFTSKLRGINLCATNAIQSTDILLPATNLEYLDMFGCHNIPQTEQEMQERHPNLIFVRLGA